MLVNRRKKKERRRQAVKTRVRRKIRGTSERPRLTVFRSNRQLHLQVIDDDGGVTLASVSTLEKASRFYRERVAAHGVGIALQVGQCRRANAIARARDPQHVIVDAAGAGDRDGLGIEASILDEPALAEAVSGSRLLFHEAAVPYLLTALESETDAGIRLVLVESLGKSGGDDEVTRLGALLTEALDGDPDTAASPVMPAAAIE